jgi:hypothetical protein
MQTITKTSSLCGLCPLSNILKECNVSETGSISILMWKGGEAPTHLGQVDTANLNRCTTEVIISIYAPGIRWEECGHSSMACIITRRMWEQLSHFKVRWRQFRKILRIKMKSRIFSTRPIFFAGITVMRVATFSQCITVYYFSLVMGDPFSVKIFHKSLYIKESFLGPSVPTPLLWAEWEEGERFSWQIDSC